MWLLGVLGQGKIPVGGLSQKGRVGAWRSLPGWNPSRLPHLQAERLDHRLLQTCSTHYSQYYYSQSISGRGMTISHALFHFILMTIAWRREVKFSKIEIMGWLKSLFQIFHTSLQENPNKLFLANPIIVSSRLKKKKKKHGRAGIQLWVCWFQRYTTSLTAHHGPSHLVCYFCVC